MTGITTYLSVLMLNVNGLNSPIKRHRLTKWIKKEDPATEANRRRGPGTTEKIRSKRINLEGNTHAQEINASQLPV
jgi:hypothetical protein